MTVRYVGPGGNNANSGLSWALRKLTLNGVEDSPVAAGDTVYVGPGTYRELLTLDVSGTAGNVISYIGDYSGANTDGVGGVVRITGSDNDQTATRANCIACTAQRNHRTFRGFLFDSSTSYTVTGGLTTSGTNWIIEQCAFLFPNASYQIVCGGANQAAWTIRNCYFLSGRSTLSIWFYHSGKVSNCGHVVENCILIGNAGTNGSTTPLIGTSNIGGITVRNSMLSGSLVGIQVMSALEAGQTIIVNNCILFSMYIGLLATTAAEFVENYNNIFDVTAARININAGANSTAYPPLLDMRWYFEMVGGGRILTPFDLASYSQLVNVAGTSPTTTDMRGTSVQGTQREWGALEYDSTLLIKSADGGGAVSISPFRGNLG